MNIVVLNYFFFFTLHQKRCIFKVNYRTHINIKNSFDKLSEKANFKYETNDEKNYRRRLGFYNEFDVGGKINRKRKGEKKEENVRVLRD